MHQQFERRMSVSRKGEWNQQDKGCARCWVHKSCSSSASFRLIASNCCLHWDRFLFRAVVRGDVPTPFTTSTGWELYERVKSVNAIRRTKFVQGFECTKTAVLPHRSGCLLRTVVPIETDFFSERLCVVTSRLPWRRLCPWLQRSTSRSTFHWICDIQPMYYCWVFIECLGYWFHGRAANKRRFSTSRKNIHWFLGVLCRMPAKDENKKILEYQRWLIGHKAIQPMHLYKKPFTGQTVLVRQLPLRFPSTSFKSRWPRFLGNVWIKMISFDVLIAPACPRHCNGGYAVWREHIIAWLSKCVRGLHFPMLGLETGLETEMGKTAGTYCTKT